MFLLFLNLLQLKIILTAKRIISGGKFGAPPVQERVGHTRTRGNWSLAEGGSGMPVWWSPWARFSCLPRVLLVAGTQLSPGQAPVGKPGRVTLWLGDTAPSLTVSLWVEVTGQEAGLWWMGACGFSIRGSQGRGLAHRTTDHCGHVFGAPFPVQLMTSTACLS